MKYIKSGVYLQKATTYVGFADVRYGWRHSLGHSVKTNSHLLKVLHY